MGHEDGSYDLKVKDRNDYSRHVQACDSDVVIGSGLLDEVGSDSTLRSIRGVRGVVAVRRPDARAARRQRTARGCEH